MGKSDKMCFACGRVRSITPNGFCSAHCAAVGPGLSAKEQRFFLCIRSFGVTVLQEKEALSCALHVWVSVEGTGGPRWARSGVGLLVDRDRIETNPDGPEALALRIVKDFVESTEDFLRKESIV